MTETRLEAQHLVDVSFFLGSSRLFTTKQSGTWCTQDQVIFSMLLIKCVMRSDVRISFYILEVVRGCSEIRLSLRSAECLSANLHTCLHAHHSKVLCFRFDASSSTEESGVRCGSNQTLKALLSSYLVNFF
jgi:hypothetical protein